jgi:hypothetical protein
MKTPSRLLAVSCALLALGLAPGSSGATAPFGAFTRSDLAVSAPNSIAIQDLNHDGKADLATTSNANVIAVFLAAIGAFDHR